MADDYEKNEGFGSFEPAPQPAPAVPEQEPVAPEPEQVSEQEQLASTIVQEPQDTDPAPAPAKVEPEVPQVDPTEIKPAEPTLVAPAAPAEPVVQAARALEPEAQPAEQMGPGSTWVKPQPSPPQMSYQEAYAQSAPAYTPPAPAYTQLAQAYNYTYTPPAPTPVVEAKPAQAKTVGRGRSFIWGLLGGIIGAAAIACGLYFAGILRPSGSTATATTGNGQTFTINASDTDVSVAKAVSAKTLPSVVSVYCTLQGGSSMGSGVILDTDGNIITNNHVINGAQSISVTIDGVSYDAIVVGTDASSDIAVLRADLDGAEVTPIEVGDSSLLAPGDWVMTVGSPFGLESSVSAGIVSSLYRSEVMTSTSGNTLYANLIQVDAAINPGNSGGALVNAQGQLVGICTLFSSDTQSFAGIGFAIPGNYAVEIAQMIISGEQVTHAYIGLSMMTVNQQVAAANNLSSNYGAYIAEVIEEGPAEAAGFEVGDIVIAFDGEKIETADDMLLAVRSHHAGETVTVTVMRGDKRVELEVTLGTDEKLQELQAQQREQQQTEQEQQQDFWNRQDYGDGYGNGDGYTTDDTYDEVFERWLEELFGEEGGQGYTWDINTTPYGNGR